jgi:DUF4097 and DUF4098 domain-containing protein YvlB
MHRTIVTLLVLFLLAACRAEPQLIALPVQQANVEAGQALLIQLKSGEVVVRGGADGQVRVEGQTVSPDQTKIRVETIGESIRITGEDAGRQSSSAALYIEVSVPDDVPLKIETDSAAIAVRDYRGRLDAESVSGDISIENGSGEIMAHSNRGDVRVQNSTGTMSVVGNYGLLTVEGSRGDIGVSTIMGTIDFNGSIQPADSIRLETDHGPVAVKLSPDSALSYEVTSNSGEVACMLPDVTATLRTCKGDLNDDGGALTIRTVSGAVTLQLIP